MIGVSRCARATRAGSARARTLRGWHGLCIVAGMPGCFAIGSIDYVVENQQPVVQASSFPDDGRIVLEREETSLYVVATDPEGDDVRFLWTVDDQPVVDQIQIEDGSMITIVRDTELDGQDLRCVIYDGQSDEVTLLATLEVP